VYEKKEEKGMGILKDIFRQLTGGSFREGKLSISYWASIQMHELKLNVETLEDVFRHGRRVTTIVQDYQNYSISIGYRWDENKKQYVITSVRLYKIRNSKQ
jgi:hypothetical protein